MKQSIQYFGALCLLLSVLWGCKPAYQTAKEKFDLGEYERAVPLFQEALAKSAAGEKGKINFFIAESYRLSNRLDKAMPAYEQAIAEKYSNDKLLFYYGLALKATGDYAEASKQMELAARSSSDRDILRRSKLEVQSIKVADSLSKTGNSNIKLTNLESVNTPNSEYSPILVNGQLVFSSTRRQEETYLANGEGFADLYYLQFTDTAQKTGTVTPFNAAINADGFHDASATFSKDGKTMIFARSNSGEKREETIMDVNLYESKWANNEWGQPLLMDYICNEKKWDGSPSLSADGQTLYFASEREDGYGGLDIYSSKKNTRGEWSKPKNVGKEINTPGNDMFPYVDDEGKLYFASDGHPGLGGLDLFTAERKDGVITVKNLGKPFSSPFDDFGFMKESPKTGYFTSNRIADGAKGNDDIYYFADVTPAPPKETPKTEVKRDVKVRYLLAGISYGYDDSIQTILPDVKLSLNGPNEIEALASGNDGRFLFTKEIEIGKNYVVKASRGQEYLDEEVVFVASKGIDLSLVKGNDTTVVFYTEVILEKNTYVVIDKGEETVSVNNILYDLAKHDIRPDAAHELDKLVAYLKRRPNLKIELGSHTDVRGNDEYNQALSERRAKAAVEYIVAQGIEKNRIVAKGYGETDLFIKDARTEAEHQQNRRTTVKVLGR